MKKKKILVHVATIAVVMASIIGFYFAGFRITYDPDLITDWDAVSGCAAWAGVIASVVAIWYAIQVPKRIAARQDKIALFEKRLTCYCEIEKLLTCGRMLEDKEDKEEILSVLYSVFCKENADTNITAKNELIAELNFMQLVLISGKFLFHRYDWSEAVALCDAAQNIIDNLHIEIPSELSNYTKILKSKKESYCKKCKDFSEKYKAPMEEELNLK